MATKPNFQTPKTKTLDRTDHCWTGYGEKQFICCLCGAIVNTPPEYPTASGWTALRYERLTDIERKLVPFKMEKHS